MDHIAVTRLIYHKLKTDFDVFFSVHGDPHPEPQPAMPVRHDQRRLPRDHRVPRLQPLPLLRGRTQDGHGHACK